MGQGSSKVMVTIPSNIMCFPYFQNEDEVKRNCINATSCLSQARRLMNLASEMAPSEITKARILMSATTCLFKTILDRLCKKESSKLQSEDTPAPTAFANINCTKNEIVTEIQSTNSTKSLESALVQVKIDKAVANAAVAELHAKIVAIRNRYKRLLSQISEDDRRLEVVPAFTLCEEVLELFRDQNHVFWKNPLVSAPFVVTFAGIYTSVGELSLMLIPSYRNPLNKQILLLQDTLVEYKQSCIKVRDTSIKIRPHAPESMIEGALGGERDASFYVEDRFLDGKGLPPQEDLTSDTGKYRSFDDFKEAIQTYKKTLEDKYDSFFEDVLESVRSFSGFKHENHRPSSQFNKDDDKTNLE